MYVCIQPIDLGISERFFMTSEYGQLLNSTTKAQAFLSITTQVAVVLRVEARVVTALIPLYVS